ILEASRETGPDRVDENHVGEAEPAVRIVVQNRRIGRAIPLHAEIDSLGPDRAHVEEDRRRAWTAVEREGDGSGIAARRDGVRGVDDLADRLALAVMDVDVPDRSRVANRTAVEADRLLDRLVRRHGRKLDLGLVVTLSRSIIGERGRGAESESRGN